MFGKGLVRLCPTPESLLAPLGVGIIRTWLRSLQWSIYACEKEHASCRRLCASHGPGRKSSLVARERILETARAVHVQRCDFDPAGARRPLKRSVAIAVGPAQEGPPNPLYNDAPAPHLQLAPWQGPRVGMEQEAAVVADGHLGEGALQMGVLLRRGDVALADQQACVAGPQSSGEGGRDR